MSNKVTKLREDHILWTCKCLKDSTANTYCNKLNGMLDKQCTRCKAKREIGSVAVNRTRQGIGKLIEKDTNGVDVWEYSDDSPIES
ncbi:hypothetical protein FLONG3_5233 [Fusarium longipes]|uniref:Uncharacterized protein n=1 Tax=Fusarium longipes TaxID=694270 RepID=A0A395SVS2_9HYPO|nr:hypothetical protein FLONG3_5233 [Fusarium longipes]